MYPTTLSTDQIRELAAIIKETDRIHAALPPRRHALTASAAGRSRQESHYLSTAGKESIEEQNERLSRENATLRARLAEKPRRSISPAPSLQPSNVISFATAVREATTPQARARAFAQWQSASAK